MTINYSGEVANGSSFGCFWKILWKFNGSVYKLVWRELIVFLGLYYAINLTYRYGLNKEQKVVFENMRRYFESKSETIPMSFMLGFYVSLVVKRFFEQFRLLPWPDTLAIFVSAAIPGNTEMSRLMRRNIMRYMMLAYVITMQQISLRVKKRFPTWSHLVDAGLVLESERKIFELMDEKSTMSKYWMPLVWATNIIARARKDGIIVSDQIVQTLLMELADIRRRLSSLIGYDTVNIPIVYTQVVTLVLYTYFLSALMGRQMVPPVPGEREGKYEDPSFYFPLFTALQFCFYFGWLKVAEVLINPFGEDDDDLELNWLIDRHIKASYMISDEMHEEYPELLRDQYFEEIVPKDLPYTVATEHYRKEEPKGSAEHYKVKESDAMYTNVERKSLHDVYYESIDTPMTERRKSKFSRQGRSGSGRSSSTIYSGLFGVKNFINSRSEKTRRENSGHSIFHHRREKKSSRTSETYLDPKTIDHEHFNRPRVSISDAKLETYRIPDNKDSNRKNSNSIASDVAMATNRMNQMATLILSPINDVNGGKGGTIQLKNDTNSIVQFNVQSAGAVPNSFVIVPATNGNLKSNISTISASIPYTLATVPESGSSSSNIGRAVITEIPCDTFQSTNERSPNPSSNHKSLESTRSLDSSLSGNSSQSRVLQKKTSDPTQNEVYV